MKIFQNENLCKNLQSLITEKRYAKKKTFQAGFNLFNLILNFLLYTRR